MFNATQILLNNEINPLSRLHFRASFKSLNQYMQLAQLRAKKDQKEFMRKKLKEIQDKVKVLNIKIS